MATLSAVSQFFENCNEYPLSYSAKREYELAIQSLQGQLAARSEKIFDGETKAYVDFVETDAGNDAKFISKGVTDSDGLKEHLLPLGTSPWFDPKCRFIFIHAPHSRHRLRITLPMMKQILHYHQVMPTFLEHVFPFRAQHRPEGFHGAGFRRRSCLSTDSSVHNVPGLQRSSQQIEFCYNLKTVESSGDVDDPWTIRQCSIYHQFDIERQRALWIVIKGNQNARDFIRSRVCGDKPYVIGDSVTSALRFSLKVHLDLCKWATENWHWHIDVLERRLDDSRRALSARINNLTRWTTHERGLSITTMMTNDTEKTAVDQSTPWLPNGIITSSPTTMTGQSGGSPALQQHQSANRKLIPLTVLQKQFKFDNIQQAHSLEEKLSDCLLVLQSNARMVEQVKREYENLLLAETCPDDIKAGCDSAIRQFSRAIEGVNCDFEEAQSRVQALLHLIQERKTLLYGILDYQNMVTNRELAEAANTSAQKMEVMTKKMRVDTASMKTITTVTLFFLPGTFISTIMSTPIITFKDGTMNLSDREIGYGALKLFVVVSGPLMILTFAAWIIVNCVEKRKAKRRDLEASPV